jgi:hypothetical protein
MAELFPPAAVGAQRKIFVTARFAAIGGNSQAAPQKREGRIHVFSGDALQFRIAANGTMGVKRIAERHGTGVKPGFTLFATPGINAEEIEDVVRSKLAARTSRVLGFTHWADHANAAEPFSMSSG